MKLFFSIVIFSLFTILAIASGDTDSSTAGADESKCDVCKKVYKKSNGWTWDNKLLCVVYRESSSGIFCSRYCAQDRALANGKTECHK